MPVNDYLVPLATCTLTAAIVCLDTMLLFIKRNHCRHHRVFGLFLLIAILHTSIGIGYQYWVLVSLAGAANIIGYWILGAFRGIILTQKR